MRTTLAAMVGACVLAASATAVAQETAAPAASPPVALVTGAVLLGVAYVPSYAAWLGQALQQTQCLGTAQGWGIFSCNHVSERTLALPLVGPWTTLASGQLPGGQWTGGQKAVLVADGVAQDLGFALAAYGAIRLLTAPRHPGPAEPPPAVTLEPGAGRAMAGVTTVVRF
ncbi:MAG: hypothetical protein ABSE49_25250 [Polyangiaceae bacterium]|jgi:hypothetical protein